jgi:quercetin dioxygenase-like cupin family protein
MELRKGEPRVSLDLFGGRGQVQVWDLLADHDAAPEPFIAALSCELEPGGSVGRHVQEYFPEIVIGLAGIGEATVDGRALRLAPGDVVHLPLGGVLELRNGSDRDPLRYLIVKARG